MKTRNLHINFILLLALLCSIINCDLKEQSIIKENNTTNRGESITGSNIISITGSNIISITGSNIIIDYTTIPDDNFRNAIIQCFQPLFSFVGRFGETLSGGFVGDDSPFLCYYNYSDIVSATGNMIRTDALQSITDFNYPGPRFLSHFSAPIISSLSGVDQMVNLFFLDVRGNELSNVDLSNNTKLNCLYIAHNQLTSLDLSNHNELRYLEVSNNQLTNLDLRNNTNLNRLYIAYNQLTNLDLRNNTGLRYLEVNNNQLTNLDLSNNTILTHLNVKGNGLSGLNLTSNTALQVLVIEDYSILPNIQGMPDNLQIITGGIIRRTIFSCGVLRQ